MFYGFSRYHLRHGVPWVPQSRGTAYRRVTVTLRSVPPLAPTKRRKGEEEGRDGKQRRLMEVLLGPWKNMKHVLNVRICLFMSCL